MSKQNSKRTVDDTDKKCSTKKQKESSSKANVGSVLAETVTASVSGMIKSMSLHKIQAESEQYQDDIAKTVPEQTAKLDVAMSSKTDSNSPVINI